MKAVMGALLLLAAAVCYVTQTVAAQYDPPAYLTTGCYLAAAFLFLAGIIIGSWGLAEELGQPASPLAIVFCGGLMMFGSMFFRLTYGPWGAEISYVTMLSYNARWECWPLWIAAWPVFFGLWQAIFAITMLVYRRWPLLRLVWVANTFALIALAAFELWDQLILRRGIVPLDMVVTTSGGIALVLAILMPFVARDADRRTRWSILLGCGWILVKLWPVSEWTPLHTVLWAYGLGYWMLLAGTILVTVGSARRWSFGPVR